MAGGRGNRDGFALIGVLVFCFILVPICAVLARSSRSLAHEVRGDVDGFRADLLAGGIAEVVAVRIGSDRRLFNSLNGRSRICRLHGYDVAVSLRDHDGKIDLNNAASELLIAGFEAAGLRDSEARLVQQFVEASRSNIDTPREIAALVKEVSLKHAPFEHVDEVQDVFAALDLPAIDMDAFFTINRGVANVEGASARPELRDRLRTLANQGVVFPDNGTFDYADILITLRSGRDGRRTTMMKSYRKISPLGDVIEIRTARPLPGIAFPGEPSSYDCRQMFGFQGES